MPPAWWDRCCTGGSWRFPTPATARPPGCTAARRCEAAIQFDALAVGVVPVLALLAATPGLRWRRRLGLMAAGGLLCFAVDTLIVALFPLLVFYKNAFTDVIGTFLGLIAFVGAPVIIWFALTFRELQAWLPSLRSRARAIALNGLEEDSMADNDIEQELQRLREENERLKARRSTGEITLRVSEKGAVSVYGLGRFPVTLYQEQWEKLLAHVEQIRAFIAENREHLKRKV